MSVKNLPASFFVKVFEAVGLGFRVISPFFVAVFLPVLLRWLLFLAQNILNDPTNCPNDEEYDDEDGLRGNFFEHDQISWLRIVGLGLFACDGASHVSIRVNVLVFDVVHDAEVAVAEGFGDGHWDAGFCFDYFGAHLLGAG